MFNSGIKGSQRCNGFVPPSKSKILSQKTFKLKDTYNDKSLTDRNFYNFDAKIKSEPDNEHQDFECKITAHSIIGLSEDNVKTHKLPIGTKPRLKWGNIRGTHHEALQRIESLSDFYNHYQQYWFSASLEKFKLEDRSRQERLEITRHEFMRHLQQIMRSNVGKANKLIELPIVKNVELKNSLIKDHHLNNHNSNNCNNINNCNNNKKNYNDRLVAPKICEIESCHNPALPCTLHCTLHIMYNTDQVLFGYCTAKFADNTQCSIPVFDILHELPLCREHAMKRDNYKLYQEAKPKKLRKKVKPSAMIRPQKRNKKKKKSPLMKVNSDTTTCAILDLPVHSDEIIEESPDLEEDIHMDHVLGLNESDGLEQVLETQASHLLEETDISTVLSTIQVDEFSDFFAVNRNGEYEPSREEAEELEKALAAVDNDVKSLEKLSQSQGCLLDSLLDEHTLVDTLVQIPDVFHNGYTTATASCGDNMVAQTSSFLLPVESQSHS